MLLQTGPAIIPGPVCNQLKLLEINMMKNKFILAVICLCAMGATMCACSKSSEPSDQTESETITSKEALEAFDAFTDAFFDARGQFERDTDKSGTTAVAWTQATMFDMILNAYQLSGDEKYLSLLKKHFEGCKNSFTFDWYDYSHWDLYDDMMWWVGALARAYEVTGEKEFLTISEEGFKRVWYGKTEDDGKGFSELDALGSFGGDDPQNPVNAMYWDWKFGRTGKMSCVHFPTMIAAIELYHCTKNADYLEKAKTLYAYGSTQLFNPETGAIADSKHAENASADWRTLVYNQATAMAAFAMLYLETGDKSQLDNANKAMQYILDNKKTANGVIKPEGNVTQTEVTDEKGIYNAILATYVPLIIDKCGQTQYKEFIRKSVELGWKNRDSRDLTNKFLEKKLNSTQVVSSYTASGVPALMLAYARLADGNN